MSRLEKLDALRKATLNARTVTRDNSIGAQAKNGKFQIVRVTFNCRGRAEVIALTDWLAIEVAIEFLINLK